MPAKKQLPWSKLSQKKLPLCTIIYSKRMKKIFLILIGISGPALSVAQKQPALKLWYNKPAEYFEETLPLGNGRSGATVFGGSFTDKIFLNDITLWSGEPVKADMNPEAYKNMPAIREALKNEQYRVADSLMRKLQGKYSESFAPLGTFYIDFKDKSKPQKYRRELNIDEAVARIDEEKSGVKIAREYFVSYPDKVFAIRITASEPVDFDIRQNSLLRYKTQASGNSLKMSGRAPLRADPNYYNKKDRTPVVFEDRRGTAFVSLARVLTRDGKVIAGSDSVLSVRASKETLILISMATSFNGFDKDPVKNGLDEEAVAAAQLAAAEKKSFQVLKNAHVSDYKKYYDRVKLDLLPEWSEMPTDERLRSYATGKEDKYLETLYFQFGRYLLISSSRTPDVPANLQGLWNPYMRPPWSSNYTMNINAEENYWLAENTNLSEMHQPFLGFIGNLEKTGKITARTFYGASGWTCAHNSDIWAMTNPVGDFGGGDPVWANWAMGGAWASTHLWEHYAFTGDKKFLKEYAYPLMRGAAEFCLDMLVEDKDGMLVTSPSTSPENKYITDKGYKGATLYGATADLGMVRELFMQVIEATHVINGDAVFRNKLESALSRMKPYQVGKKGHLQEWYYDWEDEDPKHRHQSHLFGLYPGNHINTMETPKLADAARKTLEIKGDETTGWSKGWRINLWARLRDGNRAYKMYRELLKYVEPDGVKTNYARGGGTYPNLFDAHPPFQIDGNFGGAAAVAEMLLQSNGENIYLLPALPDAWKSGSVKGLRARGGYEVDMTWKDGVLTSATLYAKPGGKAVVHYKDQKKNISLKPGARFKF